MLDFFLKVERNENGNIVLVREKNKDTIYYYYNLVVDGKPECNKYQYPNWIVCKEDFVKKYITHCRNAKLDINNNIYYSEYMPGEFDSDDNDTRDLRKKVKQLEKRIVELEKNIKDIYMFR